MSDFYPGDYVAQPKHTWEYMVENAAVSAMNKTSTNPTPQAQTLAREAAKAALWHVAMSITDYMAWSNERD